MQILMKIYVLKSLFPVVYEIDNFWESIIRILWFLSRNIFFYIKIINKVSHLKRYVLPYRYIYLMLRKEKLFFGISCMHSDIFFKKINIPPPPYSITDAHLFFITYGVYWRLVGKFYDCLWLFRIHIHYFIMTLLYIHKYNFIFLGESNCHITVINVKLNIYCYYIS